MKLASYKANRPGVRGLFNIAVRWWLGGPYSHTELIFSDGMAGSSRAQEGGVCLRRIEFHPDEWDIIEIDGDEAAARAWFEAHIGAKFDYLGFVGFVWRRGIHDMRRRFCVEAIAEALGFPDAYRFECCSLHAVFMREK